MMVAIIRIIILTILTVIPASHLYALEVFLDAEIIGVNRPMVRVKTNLPESTRVVIAVSNDELNYCEQVQTEVVNGMFESSPFLDNGAAIRPGTYTVNIAVEVAQFQSESVRSVIGNHGEKLQGTLVSKGMLGKTVHYSTRFEIM